MDEWSLLLVLVATAGFVGVTMMFIGFLVAMATALGNKHWGWGIAMLLVSPLAIFYCLSHPETAVWPRGLLLKGLSIAAVAGVVSYFLLQQIAA